MSRPTPVRIRPPQLAGLEALRPHAALVSAADRVRPPAGPLEEGLLVEEEDAAVARRKSGCDSPAVHCYPSPKRSSHSATVPRTSSPYPHPIRPARCGSSSTRSRIPWYSSAPSSDFRIWSISLSTE